MAAKTTGSEFKCFYNDKKFWPDGTWHDDDVILVDGVQQEDLDVNQIPDTAKVVIESGVVYSGHDDREGIALDTYFRRWKKEQNSTRIVVEVDTTKLDAVVAAIKETGGKII